MNCLNGTRIHLVLVEIISTQSARTHLLHLKDTPSFTKGFVIAATVKLVNNIVAFLLDDIRYKFAVNEVNRKKSWNFHYH